MSKRKLLSLSFVVVTILISLFAVAPRTVKSAVFIISSWDYPDAEGQGIAYVKVYNGSQLLDTWDPSESTLMEISTDTNLTLSVAGYVNTDVLWIINFEDVKNYIRHSVIVSTPSNSSVFSKQNFTYTSGGGSGDPMFYYWYDVIIDAPFIEGEIYTVLITYEIYY